ncbi:MAG: transposase [Synergistaceae bacterium]
MLEKSGKKFKFKNKLFLFDSTTISLCLSLFPWADYWQTKGGVKVHVLLDQSDYMPSFITITDAKIHDSAVSKTLNLKPGSIVAADRGYLDFEQFSRVEQKQDFLCYKNERQHLL